MPALLEQEGFTFKFWSADRGEPPHVHVFADGGRAKVWLTPAVVLASSHGYNRHQIRQILRIVKEHRDAFVSAWREYFEG